ncbi:hypothetical protein P3T76_006429 [Phytophthora citrophthora]|uniref:FYVE-type domain-containing protein n=1 Tax=Phytophthora citrophthora TaxID=4793 RepID=A0AAD9GP15_9STRA|nr:hypothetical protein P3T76_006429 [Phytophthora citrophthora]
MFDPSSGFDKSAAKTMETVDTSAPSIALLEETRRNVRLTDRRLVEVVAQDTKAINWHLLRCSVASWDKSPGNLGFAVYTTRTNALRRVMASGTIPCSVEELRQILRPTSSETYAATMHELFGEDFVHGAIVHRVADNETGSSRENGDDPATTDEVRHHRPKVSDSTVKTALFAKRHTLTRNEQWCFVDCTQELSDQYGKGFCVTMSSLDSEDIFAGKSHARECDIRQIHGVRAGYAVVPSGTKKEVRVSFYAHFLSEGSRARYISSNGRETSHSFLFASSATARVKQGVSSRAQMKRLTMMAHATARLAVLVRRRRLGAQKMTNKTCYIPRNTRCVCCASTMRSSTHMGLSSKKRVRRHCQLCGYYVCEGCSSEQDAQRSQDNAFSIVRICDNCMERVDDALYDSIPADNSDTLEPTIHPNAPGSETATKVLARLLRDTLVNASEPELPAVKNVIMHLVEEEVESPVSPLPSEHSRGSSHGRRLTIESSQEKYLLALQSQLQIPERPLSSCLLAGASGRAYPLAYSDSNAGVPLFPLPDTELERLGAVSRIRLTEVRNLPELELICTLASKELRCRTALVTLITHDTQYILASNNPVFRNGAGPRDQALCAHTIMGQLPMLVPHTAADVRFSRSQLVLRGGLRFYFGFPLFAPDGATPIGAVCCVDSEPRRVCQSQYETLEKLSHSATRIIASRITTEEDDLLER